MPKTLIVSDIHEDWRYVQRAEELAAGADAVVALGDYWDSWDGVTAATHQIISWVKEKMYDPKWTLLFGNHDLHYAFPMRELRCSGYSLIRQQLITPSFKSRDWGRLKFHTWVDDWLLTHAGIVPQTLPEAVTNRKRLLTYCRRTESNVQTQLNKLDATHPWLAAGFSRGGRAEFGGLVWADWSDMGVIPGVNQLLGHTEAFEIRRKVKDGFQSVCMDTQRRHFGWIENGELVFEAAK